MDPSSQGLEAPPDPGRFRQAAPGVLGAVKCALDEDGRPGRFPLTGSVRADLDSITWAGTGRLIRFTLHGLTQRELSRATARPNPIDVLAQGDLTALAAPAEAPDPPG
jgi:hypothetical protein